MKIGSFFIGYRLLDRAEQFELGLEGPWRWEAFDIAIFGAGMTLWCRPVMPHG